MTTARSTARAVVSALLLGALLALPAQAQDPVLNYREDDPAMSAAILEAQRTLPIYLAQVLDAEGNARADALVKVAFPTVNGGAMEVEHIWVGPFARRADGSFTGLLANDPAALGELGLGDQVDFTADMISDWHLAAPSGRYWGNYTSRVMYDQGAFGTTPFNEIFEPDPVPADWQ